MELGRPDVQSLSRQVVGGCWLGLRAVVASMISRICGDQGDLPHVENGLLVAGRQSLQSGVAPLLRKVANGKETPRKFTTGKETPEA